MCISTEKFCLQYTAKFAKVKIFFITKYLSFQSACFLGLNVIENCWSKLVDNEGNRQFENILKKYSAD